MSNSKATAKLILETPNPMTRIRIFDEENQPLSLGEDMGESTWQWDLPLGTYQVHFMIGAQKWRKLVSIMEPGHEYRLMAPTMEITGVIPRGETAETVRNVSITVPQFSGSARLLLVITGGNQDAHPAENLFLDGPGGLLSLMELMAVYGEENRLAACHLALKPGDWELHLANDSYRLVRTITMVEGWQTQVFLGSRHYIDRPTRADLQQLTMHMSRSGFEPETLHQYLTESALKALQYGRAIPREDMGTMFHEKFDNPMLGFYAAFLHLRRDRVSPRLMEQVVVNLGYMIGDSPDRRALAWSVRHRLGEEATPQPIQDYLKKGPPLKHMPMLAPGWKSLLWASAHNPNLFEPGSPIDQYAEFVFHNGTWLSWRVDDPAAQKPVLITLSSFPKSDKLGFASGPFGKSTRSLEIALENEGDRGNHVNKLADILWMLDPEPELIENMSLTNAEVGLIHALYPKADRIYRAITPRALMKQPKPDLESLAMELSLPKHRLLETADKLCNLIRKPSS